MLPSNETKSINLTLEEIAWWAMSANGGWERSACLETVGEKGALNRTARVPLSVHHLTVLRWDSSPVLCFNVLVSKI